MLMYAPLEFDSRAILNLWLNRSSLLVVASILRPTFIYPMTAMRNIPISTTSRPGCRSTITSATYVVTHSLLSFFSCPDTCFSACTICETPVVCPYRRAPKLYHRYTIVTGPNLIASTEDQVPPPFFVAIHSWTFLICRVLFYRHVVLFWSLSYVSPNPFVHTYDLISMYKSHASSHHPWEKCPSLT